MFSLRIHSVDSPLSSATSASIAGDTASTSSSVIETASTSSASASAFDSSNALGSSSATTPRNLNPNQRFQMVRGSVHLYRKLSPAPAASYAAVAFSSSATTALPSHDSLLPPIRGKLLFVLAIANALSPDDFVWVCDSYIQHASKITFIRNDGMEDRYSVLLEFVDQLAADWFYLELNGWIFPSSEVGEVCHVLFLVSTEYTPSLDIAATSPVGSTELPTYPICMERLDQDISGIVATTCDHSFQCSCVSKWVNPSCPVCRLCQNISAKPTCSICVTNESLWICVICGFVGCGRYKEGHALKHWKNTQHCYTLDLQTHRIWDYVGGKYVQRLNQSKSDDTTSHEARPSCSRGSKLSAPQPWIPAQFNINGEHDNIFLFRNHEAYTTFEGYKRRNLCDSYFYKRLCSMPVWENNKIEEYIDHWGMRGLVECDEPYHINIVKAFYANLVPLENQYGYQSYLGGQTIMVTLESISEAFNLPNAQELEKVYVTYGNWPKPPEETYNQYRNWFNKDSFEDFYSTCLPAVHRLAFLFVNNILIPKSDIKINMQYNLFFLRHMIGLTERRFNIPYVIITHISACLRYKLASLPYAHVIHKLLKHQGVDIHALSLLIQPNEPFTRPANLCREMTKHAGWVKDGNKLIPTLQAKNDWIKHPQALPNQYTDPNLPPRAFQTVAEGSSVPIPTSFNDFARAMWEKV